MGLCGTVGLSGVGGTFHACQSGHCASRTSILIKIILATRTIWHFIKFRLSNSGYSQYHMTRDGAPDFTGNSPSSLADCRCYLMRFDDGCLDFFDNCPSSLVMMPLARFDDGGIDFCDNCSSSTLACGRSLRMMPLTQDGDLDSSGNCPSSLAMTSLTTLGGGLGQLVDDIFDTV